jgi:hypothetical protein
MSDAQAESINNTFVARAPSAALLGKIAKRIKINSCLKNGLTNNSGQVLRKDGSWARSMLVDLGD